MIPLPHFKKACCPTPQVYYKSTKKYKCWVVFSVSLLTVLCRWVGVTMNYVGNGKYITKPLLHSGYDTEWKFIFSCLFVCVPAWDRERDIVCVCERETERLRKLGGGAVVWVSALVFAQSYDESINSLCRTFHYITMVEFNDLRLPGKFGIVTRSHISEGRCASS